MMQVIKLIGLSTSAFVFASAAYAQNQNPYARVPNVIWFGDCSEYEYDWKCSVIDPSTELALGRNLHKSSFHNWLANRTAMLSGCINLINVNNYIWVNKIRMRECNRALTGKNWQFAVYEDAPIRRTPPPPAIVQHPKAAAPVISANSWPKCVPGYTVVGKDNCFDFSAARSGEEFEHAGYIYNWDPKTTVTVKEYVAGLGQVGSRKVAAWRPKSSPPAMAPAATASSPAPQKEPPPNASHRLDCTPCVQYLGHKQQFANSDTYCRTYWKNSCSHPVFAGMYVSVDHSMKRLLGFSGEIKSGETVIGQQTACSFLVNPSPYGKANPSSGVKLTDPTCKAP
jgi:hypothetical protein